MNIGMDPSNFVDPALDPESYDDTEDLMRENFCFEAAQLNRQDVLMSVLDALDADDSALYELIDDELGEPTLPGERVRHNAMVWQRIGQRLHDIIATSIQAKVQVRMRTMGPLA